MKYYKLVRLMPTASNPLPTPNRFPCTYGEIFRVRYRTGFSAAGETRHIGNYPIRKAYRAHREGLQ